MLALRRPGVLTASLVAGLLGYTLVACERQTATGKTRTDGAPAAVADSAPDPAVADVLWLPNDKTILLKDSSQPALVKNGRSVYSDGTAGVSFTVVLPCEDAGRQVTEHFSRTDWRPRSTEWLNPHNVTTFGECQRHGGGIVPADPEGHPLPMDPYMRWHGEWQNERGDILIYEFGGSGMSVTGVASYLPRKAAELVRRR
jgi:hypothetical protein